MKSPAAEGPSGARTGYPEPVETAWPAGEDGLEGRWFREFVERLRRHKGLVFAVMALGTLAAWLVVSQITPRYSAQALILVGVPKTNVVDVEDVLHGLRTDRATLESELEVLRSRTLAAKVVDALGLVDEPAFNPRLRPPRRSLIGMVSMLNPLRWIPPEWRAALGGTDSVEPPPPPTPGEIERRTRAAVVARVQGAVSTRIRGRSRVIAVTVRSTDPKLAAAVANRLSDLYLLEQLEAKFDATRRATDWLNARVEDLGVQVEASERAVEAYRQEQGLSLGKGTTTVTEQQISEISTQLILARTQTAEAEARLRQVRSLTRAEGGVESAADVLASPLIQRLREQETDVARRAAEMSTELGERHPRMINVKAELEEVRAKLAAEVEKIVRGLTNALEVAQIRERTLERNLENLRAEAAKASTSQGQLRVLEREAAANRALFDTVLARWKETGRQDEIQHPDARIISHAQVPRGPSSPKKRRIIAIAWILSTFLGIVLVHLVEQLDSGFRSAVQVENMTGIGTLALIPMVSAMRLRRKSLADYVLERPASSFAESIRTLYTGVLLSGTGGTPKSILVTSSLPDEGKTTLALAMGRLLARSGRQVLLVDADLRRSKVAGELGLADDVGLLQLLAGRRNELAEAIQHDAASGLHVLTAGRGRPSNSSDLLGSSRMEALMAALSDMYELVILDSPPVHVLSDARVISRLVDTTVFAVRWSAVRREVAALALAQLHKSGANMAGVVLSMVNVRKNARYGYGDSGYYYGYGFSRRYRGYYTE